MASAFLRRRYTPGQRSVLLALADEAIDRYGQGGFSKAERRKVRSGFLTGRVESNFQNLSGGDADSAGWRQERASLYKDPTNLLSSVDRYFDEADKLYRGQSAGRLSADVQRPAAQYRGRYAQHRGEGVALLRKLVLGRDGGGAARAASGSQRPLKALVAGGTARTPVAGTAPQEPAFSARTALALPELAGDVPSSDVPGRERTSELARLLRSTPTTPPVPVGLPRVVEPGGGGRPSPLNPARFQVGRSGRRAVQRTGRREGEVLVWRGGRWVYARGGGPVRKLRWRPEGGTNRSALGAPVDRPGVPTAAVVRRFVERLADAAEFPITYGTGSRHSRLTASGNESDHWVGRGIDLPLRGRQLRIAGTKALRILGVPRAKARRMAFRGGIFNVPYRGRRHQVIVRAPDHWDHLHWGISR